MEKRWLRIAGIAVAIFLVLLIALPFLIGSAQESEELFD
jgi:hypothetical protein